MTTTSDTSVIDADAPGEVLGLLREQSALYTRLESFAARQRSLITADDAAPLLALLADRQRLSVDLTRIARRLEPIRRDWPVFRRRLTPVQQVEADRLLIDVKHRLRRVIESDERDARVLSARKQAVAGALQETHATGEAISAYRVSTEDPGGPDRLDEGS